MVLQFTTEREGNRLQDSYKKIAAVLSQHLKAWIVEEDIVCGLCQLPAYVRHLYLGQRDGLGRADL